MGTRGAPLQGTRRRAGYGRVLHSEQDGARPAETGRGGGVLHRVKDAARSFALATPAPFKASFEQWAAKHVGAQHENATHWKRLTLPTAT